MTPESTIPIHLTLGDTAVIIASLSGRVALARTMQDEERVTYLEGVLDRFDTQVVDGIITHAMGVSP